MLFLESCQGVVMQLLEHDKDGVLHMDCKSVATVVLNEVIQNFHAEQCFQKM